MKTAQDFWSRVEPGPTDTCWEWQGCLNRDGYGSATWLGKATLTHRLAWKLANGPITKPCILHSCDNPRCCNPAHLSEGTHSENMRQREERGRGNYVTGQAHHNNRLCPEEVLAIRNSYAAGMSSPKLAKLFEVSTTTIHFIINRKTWKHI